MPTATFRCDSCGAALTVLPAADLLSCGYCGSCSSLRSNLERPAATSLSPAQEQELARIDREWEQEKAPYLILRRDGSRTAPKPVVVLVGGFAYLLFVGCFDCAACSVAAEQVAEGQGPPLFPWAPFLCLPLLGVVFTFAGICGITHEFKKARRYLEASQRYRRRRAEITALPRRRVPGPCQVLGTWLGSAYWWAADALEETKGFYYIHYPGWGARFDKWVPRDRIRFPEDEE
jgi:hypothetical protein